jgi:hypothetical protein
MDVARAHSLFPLASHVTTKLAGCPVMMVQGIINYVPKGGPHDPVFEPYAMVLVFWWLDCKLHQESFPPECLNRVEVH